MKLHKFLIVAVSGTILASANGLFTSNPSTSVVNASSTATSSSSDSSTATSSNSENNKKIFKKISGSWYCIINNFYSKYTFEKNGHFTVWAGKSKATAVKSTGVIGDPGKSSTISTFTRFTYKQSGDTSYIFLSPFKDKINGKKIKGLALALADSKNPNPNKTYILQYINKPIKQPKNFQ